MQSAENIRINFINFLELENWSVQALLESKVDYSNRFQLARIGQFLIKKRNTVNIEDEVTYKRVTVKINNNGVILRDTVNGVNIGTKKQFLAKSGQFIISKIDARNGAFGIIPNELDGAIVTNDFPLFDVDEKKINPHFLLLITTTREFIKFAQSCSSGTTNRQRMDIDLFLNQKIPLPAIEEQNKIVNNYNKKIKEAKELEDRVNELKNEVERYLFEVLGIIDNKRTGITKGLQFIDYINMDKWSIDDMLKKHTFISQKFKLEKLNDVCTLITDGTHQTPTYHKEGVIFLSAKNVTKEIINWNEVKYVSKEAYVEYVKGVKPKIDDILLAKNGTTGVAAIVDVDNEFCIYVSLALLRPIKEKVYPKYLLHLINSGIARAQFFSRLIGIGVPNLHLGEIKEVVIPIPPIEIQKKISIILDSIKKEIDVLRNIIIANINEAQIEFENAIFKRH